MFKTIISLLRSISNALDEIEFNDHVGITEHRAEELIQHSETITRGTNPNGATLTSVNNDIQDLMLSLYNDGADETPKGDIVKIQEDLNSRDYVIEELIGPTGYRKWASGRLDLWGVTTTRAADTGGTNINMSQSFINTNYNLISTINELMYGFIYAKPNTNLLINIRVNNGNTKDVVGAKVSWKAEGYWK